VNTSDDDLEEEDEVGDSEDAPGEEDDNMDADGDVDMDDTPPQPPVSKRHNKAAVTQAKGKPVKGVEEKEMDLAEDDDDDEELSELDSDAEGEPDETGIQDDEMGEGVEEDEELDEEDEEDEEDEDDENESDEETPATGSRASTPDLSRLTKRQRGSLGSDFLQLPMGECRKPITIVFCRYLMECRTPS